MCSGGMYETITSEGRIVWVCYKRYFDKATYLHRWMEGYSRGKVGWGVWIIN